MPKKRLFLIVLCVAAAGAGLTAAVLLRYMPARSPMLWLGVGSALAANLALLGLVSWWICRPARPAGLKGLPPALVRTWGLGNRTPAQRASRLIAVGSVLYVVVAAVGLLVKFIHFLVTSGR